MNKGITERINNILPNLFANVFTLPDSKFSAWVGGSIFASLSIFPNFWITSEYYNEFGKGVISNCSNTIN
jgi:actin-related protein